MRFVCRLLFPTALSLSSVFAATATAAPDSNEAATTDVATETATIAKLGVTMTVQHFTLANGMRVFVIEDHSTPAFALNLIFDVGSRDEVAGHTGFAHLFEHMMFKGSKNVPDGGQFKYISGVGGETNAATTAELTSYTDVLPSQYLDMALWLESDRMRSLAITEATLENQRAAVQEEKAMRTDNAPYTGKIQDFFAQIWAGTGYGHPVLGLDADLATATTTDVQAFFDKYYVPNNATLAIVGDVEAQQVRQKVEQYFGDIPRGPDRPRFVAPDHTQTTITVQVEDKLAQQPLYLIGWKTVPREHPDWAATALLIDILLRGDSSRLSKILKDEKRAATATFSFVQESDAGSAFGGFVPNPGVSLAQIADTVRTEVEKLKKTGVSRKDLLKAINQRTADTVQSLATNAGRAWLVAAGALSHNDPTYVITELKQFQAVTAADIKRVANTYLTDKWMTLEVVPPQ